MQLIQVNNISLRRPESDSVGISLIKYRGIPEYCGYAKTRWDLIISTVIARATHTLAATLPHLGMAR